MPQRTSAKRAAAVAIERRISTLALSQGGSDHQDHSSFTGPTRHPGLHGALPLLLAFLGSNRDNGDGPVLPNLVVKGPATGHSGSGRCSTRPRSSAGRRRLLGTFKIDDPDNHSGLGAVRFLYWWKRGPAHAFDLASPLFVSRAGRRRASPGRFRSTSTGAQATTAACWCCRSSTRAGTPGRPSPPARIQHRDGPSRGSLLWLYWGGGNDGPDRVRRPVPAALVVPQQGRALDRLLPVPVGLPQRSSRTTVMFPFLAN